MKKFTVISTLRSVLLLLSALLATPYAAAHAMMTQLTPAENSVLATSPEQIVLVYSENIEPGFSKIGLFDAQDQALKTEKPILDSANPNQLSVAIAETLPSGLYRIEWQVVSVDGHKTTGKSQFSVQ